MKYAEQIPQATALALALLAILFLMGQVTHASQSPDNHPTTSRSLEYARVMCHVIEVDGTKLFYREAGKSSSPTIVLLHGNPSSSFMFRDLIPLLAPHFHVIAPDYPGFGYSDAPSSTAYHYTFNQIAETIDRFLARIGETRYVLYMQDYGGPIGMRLAITHPDRVAGIVIQNANAYKEGLSVEWRKELEQRAIEANRDSNSVPLALHDKVASFESNLKWVKYMYTRGAQDAATMSPDGYTFDAARLTRPGQDEIQDILGNDYYTNLLLYPKWQTWMRQYQPRTLIVWGRGDYIFGPSAAEAYKHDLANAKLRYYEGSHFVLEEHAAEIAEEIIEVFSVPLR